jgi:hypothetical protein
MERSTARWRSAVAARNAVSTSLFASDLKTDSVIRSPSKADEAAETQAVDAKRAGNADYSALVELDVWKWLWQTPRTRWIRSPT